MTTIMRRTVRGTATALGALAIVVGTAGCGSLLGGDDDTRTDEQEQGQEQDDSGDTSEEKGEDSTDEDTSADDSGDTSGEDDSAADEDSEEGTDGAEGAGGTGDTSDNGLQEDEDGEDSTDGSDDASDDSGTDTAAGDLSDEDLDNASQRFIDFMQVMDDGDGEAACAFFLDPSTGEPVSGETLSMCGDFVAGQMDSLEPGTMDILDASMVTATDNGDGTVSIDVMGTEFPNPMVQASDGEWYVSLG